METQHPDEIRERLATGSQAEKIFLLYRKADYGPRWKAAWEPNPVYWINGQKRKLFLFADGSALETWLPGKNARYFHHAVLDAKESRRLLVGADKAFNDGGDGIIDGKGLLSLIMRSGLVGMA
jgi:hypothetical protein